MKTPAAVLVETGQPLQVHEIQVPDPAPGEVLVEVAYSSVCHTQVLEVRGSRGEDPYLPHCLGHEGSGSVLEVGLGVQKVRPGQRVLLSWIKGEGADVSGSEYTRDGEVVNAGAVTTFQARSLISENRLTPLPDSVPLEIAPLLGCAVPTGCGVVFNTLKPEPESSLAVFGAGGVGLFAVQAAVIAGCEPVIAVEPVEEKRKLARRLGATHTINPEASDPLDEIEQTLPDGLDYAVEATGQTGVMNKALHGVRPRGGTVVVVGNAPHGSSLDLDPGQLNMGKRLLGTWGGDNVPERDFPRYFEWVRDGRLKLKPFLSDTYSLDEINRALDDLEAGRVVRPLIDCGAGQ